MPLKFEHCHISSALYYMRVRVFDICLTLASLYVCVPMHACMRVHMYVCTSEIIVVETEKTHTYRHTQRDMTQWIRKKTNCELMWSEHTHLHTRAYTQFSPLSFDYIKLKYKISIMCNVLYFIAFVFFPFFTLCLHYFLNLFVTRLLGLQSRHIQNSKSNTDSFFSRNEMKIRDYVVHVKPI